MKSIKLVEEYNRDKNTTIYKAIVDNSVIAQSKDIYRPVLDEVLRLISTGKYQVVYNTKRYKYLINNKYFIVNNKKVQYIVLNELSDYVFKVRYKKLHLKLRSMISLFFNDIGMLSELANSILNTDKLIKE